ncbi:iron-siderophore ABC transporter substrate-binding protein [Vibrio amylolyticus]|uniref:iron-siderophore ABC transporter substrate-binding protein n=1 Tax=Vibrio amylolyticus TaxID=2847292 RepID=UPI00354DF852
MLKANRLRKLTPSAKFNTTRFQWVGKLIALNIAITAALFSCVVSAQHTAEDSVGVHTLEAVPQRVAALNWDIAEQVIELGITPIAMPDIAGYQEWVVQPAVDPSVEDIGTRVEPNFERLAELNPDVIVIASPQLDLKQRLEQIAPVLYYHTYSDKHDNAQASIDNYRLLAASLGKSDFADAKLTSMEARFTEMSLQLDSAYTDGKPKVSAFRFASTTAVYLYGDNSMTQYVLQRLGFEPAIEKPATQWGVTQLRINELKNVGDGVALYFKPFYQESQLNRSVLWKAMPFVRGGRINSVEPVWNYGGAMSLLYTAEAITESLLAIAPIEAKE